jgi:hypothetical protein
MASYKDIQGFNIQNLSSDPVPFAQEKANNPYVRTWSSGGSLNSGRDALMGDGTQNAAWAAGGYFQPVAGAVAYHEQYDGSAWTETTDFNTARRYAGSAGTQTSAFIFGGAPPPVSISELYNGSTWTELADLNTARGYFYGSGTSTAALAAGGYNGAVAPQVESWNGSAWTEVTDMNTARYASSASGSSTSSIVTGGSTPTYTGVTETWNGSTWTEVADLNTARGYGGSSRDDSGNTTMVTFGGDTAVPATIANTESWDGSSWTEIADMAQARGNGLGGAGVASSALAFGGNNPYGTLTEELSYTGIPPSAPAAGYTDAIVGQIYYNTTTGSFKAIKAGGAPIGAWSSGATIPGTGAYDWGASGTQSAFLAIGGYATPGEQNVLYLYNGTTWSTPGAGLNTSRYGNRGVGTQTDALQVGGYNTPGTAYTGATESYNGSSWTELNDLNTARGYGAFFGTTSASIFATGLTPPTTAVESWNGTSWTEITDTNTARVAAGGVGTTNTAGLIFGGNPNIANTESWNGSVWTELNDLNTARRLAGSGSQTLALGYAGYIQPTTSSASTEYWDGSTWTEVADLATARYGTSSTPSGTTNAALCAGGENPPAGYTLAEEWNAAEFTINTLTTS